MRVLVRAVGAAVLSLFLSAAAAATEPSPAYRAKLDSALDGMRAGKCDQPAWSAIAADPQLARLPGGLRSVVYVSLAICVGGDQTPRWLQKATAERDAPPLAWSARFTDSAFREDASDALSSLENLLAASDGEPIRFYDEDAVFRLSRQLKGDAAKRRRLLALLDRGRWAPEAQLRDASDLWRDYSLMLLNEGATAEAVRVAKKVTRPQVLEQMRLDKRFDPVTSTTPDAFDVSFAAFATLGRHRVYYEAASDDDAAYEIIEDLRLVGRYQEALDFAEKTLAKATLVDSRGRDYRHWIEDRRALVLFDLGRFDEGVEGIRKAATRNEGDGPNVSQTINLAGMLNGIGRHEEALAILGVFDKTMPVSPYGSMWVAAERVCAASALRRPAEVDAQMAFTAAHAVDNRNARVKALLCVNDLASAAQVYVAWLGEPDPWEPLIQLSNYQPGRHAPFDEVVFQRFLQVRDSPAVRQAVAQIGRSETVPLQGRIWTDYY